MLGAVGLEILKVVGSVLVARTTKNPVYGAFAVVVGLLIWINLVSRFMLLTAAWTVTAPYDTDVAPSGTASQESRRGGGHPAAVCRPRFRRRPHDGRRRFTGTAGRGPARRDATAGPSLGPGGAAGGARP